MDKTIILASKSPRRYEILKNHGIDPIVIPANADETLPDGIGMEEAVRLLALKKARAVFACIERDNYGEGYIIGSDTIVYKDEIMGKPIDRNDARKMIETIRGTYHFVSTGVALIDIKSGEEIVLNDVTKVFCKNYSDEDIEEYLDTDEPYDKAGAYAIQGIFGKYIDRYEGDFENVVGLPFHIIEKFLKQKWYI